MTDALGAVVARLNSVDNSRLASASAAAWSLN